MDIRGIASAHPGLLYEQGLQEVATQMGLAGAGGAGAATLSQVQMIPYLSNRLMVQHPKMGQQLQRELRTHCEAIDSLTAGRPDQAADILMQRTKAIETSLNSKSASPWSLASQQEVVREDRGLTTVEEQLAAAKAELQSAKLHDHPARRDVR